MNVKPNPRFLGFGSVASNFLANRELAMQISIFANRRSQSALAIGALVCLGCVTQAHADYVPVTNNWIQVSSTAPASSASAGQYTKHDGNDGNSVISERSWMWDNTQPFPAVTIQLDFKASLGAVNYPFDNHYAYAYSAASGGFTYYQGMGPTNDDYNFSAVNGIFAGTGSDGEPAKEELVSRFHNQPGAQTIIDRAYLDSYTLAFAEPYATNTAIAGSSTSTLKAFL